MSETASDSPGVVPPPGREAELESARAVFRDLDKAWRATRTYGADNAVTRRFLGQLVSSMLAHLEEWPVLAVVVDRTELYLDGEAVYGGEESLADNLPFRLFGDGVREVRFEVGLSPEDLQAFLQVLHHADGPDDDDDVVTRLWTSEVPSITFVTAEDIVQAPWTAELEPQEHGFFASPPPSFHGVIESEQKLLPQAGTAVGIGPPAAGENLKPGGDLVGYEVTAGDRAILEHDLAAERTVESNALVLSMLRAILASERSPALLARALAVIPGVINALLSAGSWSALADLFAAVETAPEANPSFGDSGRVTVHRLLDVINQPQRVALIAAGLNAGGSLDGISGVFARLRPAAAGPLCGVLANVAGEEQRAAVRDALIRLGAENSAPVIDALGDPRPQLVLDLVRVVVAWRKADAASVLSALARHAVAEVRAEALASIARLQGKGDGAPLVAFASDGDREVRLHALRLLASGRYLAPWTLWRPHLASPEALVDQPRADKRVLFHALAVTAGDGAVPFWQGILEGRGWKQRQKREETALLAIRELSALGTPAARDALEAGRRESTGPVRKACAAALEAKKGGPA